MEGRRRKTRLKSSPLSSPFVTTLSPLPRSSSSSISPSLTATISSTFSSPSSSLSSKSSHHKYCNKSSSFKSLSLSLYCRHHYLIIHSAVLLCTVTWLCYAQDSDFALRPFPASLHLTASRRHDASHHMAPIDIGMAADNVVSRHPMSSISSVLSDEPNLVPILTAPVPRGSGSNPRPSFQRIRLNNNNNNNNPKSQISHNKPLSISLPTSARQIPKPTPSPFVLPEEFVPVTLTESPVPNFHRLVGLSVGGRMPQSPIQQPPATISISGPALSVVAAPQRQSFRRIKPPTHGNWRVNKPKTTSSTNVQTISIEPSRVRSNTGGIISSTITNDKLHGRGPISAQDEDLSHKTNALDNEDDPGIIDRDRSSFYGNRLPSETSSYDDNGILVIESLSRNSNVFEPVRTRATPSQTVIPSVVPTPTIPLTYYTTFTYYTTVVRGPHTAMLSREQVVSSTQLRPIDRNIVTAIEFNDGYIQPSASRVMLGTKTKGVTTTIYNVASRVQIFNDDLYKVIFATSSKMLLPPTFVSSSSSSPSSRIAPTRVQVTPITLESTQVMNRHHTNKPAKSSVTVRLEQLQNQLKKQLSLLTYYYTLIEGSQTQYSTRVEESTTNYNGYLATLLPSIAPSIDSYGLLKIIQPSSIVPLGSRATGQSTTVVNLALNNYIKFSRIKDVKIDIVPTSSVSPGSQIHSTHISTISSSMEHGEKPEKNTFTQTETPKLSSSMIELDSSLPTPALSSSAIIAPSETATSSSRSRTNSVRRPGIRIKLKPIRSKLVNHMSRHSSKSLESTESTVSIQSSSKYTLSIAEDSSSLLLTPTIVDQTPVLSTTNSRINVEPNDSLVSSQRKKVAFTLRRPGFSGGNRFFSRRPSSHLFFSYSSPVVITSSPTIELTSSHSHTPLISSIEPSSFISTSISPEVSFSTVSMPTPSLANIMDVSSSSVHHQPLSPSPVWHSSSQTLTSKLNKNRLVVLTRLAGAVNKWSPMYNSRVRVSSRRLIKSTNPIIITSMGSNSMTIEPSSTYETLVETTTHTVPFTMGSTVTYTTLEETNSRILSDSMEETITPSIGDITRIITQSEQLSTVSTPEINMNTIHISGISSSIDKPPSSSFIIVETSDVLTTSTLYSTYTYFATLFNGTQTSITPLEEVKTEYLTLREPVTITRTIIPSVQFTPSNIMPSSKISSSASTISIDSVESSNDIVDITRLITETYSTQTTLTHFITLFSGTHTILSSIEEISPTMMTRTRYITPYTIVSSTSSSSSNVNIMTESDKIESSSSQVAYDTSSTVPIYSITSSIMPSLSDSVSTDNLSPSQPMTTPGSISYETGPMNQDILIVDQVFPEPNRTLLDQQHSTSATTVLEPGSVIELEDLLEGVQDAGPIGETIKDIVKDIFKEGDDTTTTTPLGESNIPSVNQQPATTVSPLYATTKATPSLNRYLIYLAPQKSSKYYDTARDNNVIFSTQSDGDNGESSVSTRYVTSVEKSIRTLTLTSTKVYYTRDSPLTITSVLTTTLPPITYVSTIIGSKTILGTYNSISPTKTITTMIDSSAIRPMVISSSSTPIISSSSTTITNSSTVLPTATTRPRLHRPKLVNDMTNKAKVASILNSNHKDRTNKPSKSSTPTTTTLARNVTMTMDHLQLCDPVCNVTNKEYCRESETNRYTCECRPGYVRRPSDNLCQEIKNYLVTVRVSKTAESEVAATSASDGELQKYARVARRQVGKADGIAGLQVLSVDHSARSKGALVNLTIQINHKTNNVHDELSKKLEPLGRVEKVVDFDECSSSIHNDCSPRARCINEPGSYSCQCFEPFIDLDRTIPGRLCVTEIKSCDYCHGRGDCWRNNSDTVCRCHPMFIGRRCEINGLLLAILVPIVAILVIIAIICFFYCSRKLRQRNRRFKNLTAYGPVAVIGGTLDRKAMLETSSESSDPQHRTSHYTNESNPASARGSMARRNTTSRRESEPSLDRSLASYSATGSHYNSLPHQIVIPRARPTYALHPGQVYMW